MGARRRRRVGAVALCAVALAGAGCGAEFKLPTERLENRAAPSDGSYQMVATWGGLTGVTDVLLIPGPQLYLAFRGNPGRVLEYATTQPTPLATDRFAGVRNPAALAASPASVFVLDQGDTAAARALSAIGDTTWYELDCGRIGGVQRTIVDLSQYWYVREYDLKGRAMKSSFTDTTFAWVNGIAADAQGRVYVSGVIMHCFVDPFDAREKTLDNEYRIYRYEPGSGDRFVIGGWRRDPTFEIAEGTGIGSTLDPRGMTWSALTGAALYFSDLGNNEVQKFDLLGSLSNSFKIDICDADTTVLVQPLDVEVDEEGYAYVVDAGNRRVLRYDPEGRICVQRVDLEPNAAGLPLTAPAAVAAGNFDGRSHVYVVDPAVNEVLHYRRRE